jgi:hypothetical protein
MDVLSGVALNAVQGKVAVVGGCSVRVMEMVRGGSSSSGGGGGTNNACELKEIKADALELEPHQV